MTRAKKIINKIKKIPEKSKSLAWLMPYFKRNFFSILLFSVLGLSGILTGLISSLCSKDLIDMITGHQAAKLLRTFSLLIGTTLLTTAITQLSSLFSTKITQKLENQIQAETFDKIISSQWEFLSKYHSADLLIRWESDSSRIASGVLTLLPNIINCLIRFITSLVIVIQYDYTFAIVALMCMPISFLSSRLSMKNMQRSNRASYASMTRFSTFSQEIFANLQTVKALDMLSLSSKKLKEYQADSLDARMRHQRATALNSVIFTLISLFTTYAVYGWGIYRVWSNIISYGTMTLFLSLTASLSSSIESFVGLFPTTAQLALSVERIKELTDLPKEDYSTADEVEEFFNNNKTRGLGLIADNISYAYPNGTEVFSGASFEAYPQEIISLVGPSGEGKTTMLRFLLSIINIQSGNGYLCNNHTDETLPLSAAVRRLIAYVPQGNTMLAGTIADNMRNVAPDATDDDIILALEIACAWDFVQKLPDTINTPIGEKGSGFSEGQAQRLSIARAIIKKAPILLLDEATSALDIETEKKVLTNILKDDYPRTTIVTTHRPSVLRLCNRVYSIHDKSCTLLTSNEINELLESY